MEETQDVPPPMDNATWLDTFQEIFEGLFIEKPVLGGILVVGIILMIAVLCCLPDEDTEALERTKALRPPVDRNSDTFKRAAGEGAAALSHRSATGMGAGD